MYFLCITCSIRYQFVGRMLRVPDPERFSVQGVSFPEAPELRLIKSSTATFTVTQHTLPTCPSPMGSTHSSKHAQ